MERAPEQEVVAGKRLCRFLPARALSADIRSVARVLRKVKHLVLCRVEKRPPKLDLDVYPDLPKANVGKTCAASYLYLMSGCVR